MSNDSSLGPVVLTLEAVNALVPKLNEICGRQLERRADIENRLASLGRMLGDVPKRIVVEPGDTPAIAKLKRELAELVSVYQDDWRGIEQLGAVIKDPKVGLLDFYGRVDGKLVWLCWKYGETKVEFYHALDEGFSGRKPLVESMKQRLLN
ncbi:MAG: DUF2203 domain-containing protein [Polyangiaceae bacterium]